MKNITLIAIALIAISSSCGKLGNRFKLEGEIKNADGKTLLISEMTRKELMPVDSVVLNKKGEFMLRGESETPAFYLLYLEKKQREGITMIIHPGDKININADASGNIGRNYTVTGSENMSALKQLDEQIFLTMKKIDSLSIIYQNNSESPKLDSIRKTLDKTYKTIQQNTKEYLIQYIQTHKSTLAGLRALYIQINPQEQLIDPVDDLKYYQLVDSFLYEKHPKTEAVQTLHEQIKESKFVKAQREAYFKKLKPGKTAPDIVLPNPEGDTIALSSLKGKYVLLDFWASWCRPCRIENPHLVKAYNKYHDKGFEIFQVSLDRKKQAWINAIKSDKLGNWTHVSDLQYWNSNVVKLYNIKGIPTNYLLDKEGKIMDKNLRGDDLDKKLAEIFNQ